MAFADPARVESHIKDILNATDLGWGGSVTDARRSSAAVTQARIEAGMEVLRAIASNPQNGFHGSLATLVTVTHNQFLPAHDGEPGVPTITTFPSGTVLDGIPADPDEIDSYRFNPGAYSGGYDGVAVSHDSSAGGGIPSPVAGRYSIVNGRIKFTGYSAQIPLIQLTRAMADTSVPENYEPTVVKLAIPKLVKEGDNLANYASAYAQAGQQDLIQIANGALEVSPIPDIAAAQRQGVT